MSDLPYKSQLTFVTKTGAQVQILLAHRAEWVHKAIEHAREKKGVAELDAVVDDEKIATDKIYLNPAEISFYSIIQPNPVPTIHVLDKKILTP